VGVGCLAQPGYADRLCCACTSPVAVSVAQDHFETDLLSGCGLLIFLRVEKIEKKRYGRMIGG
jgi:hypothetical protein